MTTPSITSDLLHPDLLPERYICELELGLDGTFREVIEVFYDVKGGRYWRRVGTAHCFQLTSQTMPPHTSVIRVQENLSGERQIGWYSRDEAGLPLNIRPKQFSG